MGIMDFIGKAATYIIQQNERILKENERKINKAEHSERMSDPEYASRIKEAREKLNEMKGYNSNGVELSSNGSVSILGKSLNDWDYHWIGLGILSQLTLNDLARYNHNIGVYKAEMNGEIFYIGKAIEYDNGGFRKRLRDYVRDSNSARKHNSGGKMNENSDNLYISILVVGDSSYEVDAVKLLERELIQKYRPQWNVQYNRL